MVRRRDANGGLLIGRAAGDCSLHDQFLSASETRLREIAGLAGVAVHVRFTI
jgi:hypothetical protein